MRMFFWVSTYFLDRKLSPDTRVELIEQLSLQALKVVIADSLRVDNNYFAWAGIDDKKLALDINSSGSIDEVIRIFSAAYGL